MTNKEIAAAKKEFLEIQNQLVELNTTIEYTEANQERYAKILRAMHTTKRILRERFNTLRDKLGVAGGRH